MESTLSCTLPMTAVRPLQDHLQRWLAVWWAAGGEALPLGRTYTRAEQQACEAELERLLAAVAAEAEQPPADDAGRAAVRARLQAAAEPLLASALGLGAEDLQALAESGLVELTSEFVRAARRFDPTISAEDIYQASRNVWTMNVVQMLLGREASLTPAVFAYSMLYPYSDNYLDDPTVAPGAKAAFGERFGRRLAGESVAPANAHEERIYALVGMIEGQFERGRWPQVYESLLAIHAAQCRSLALLRRAASPYEVDVLGITFEKGGASVVADGCLVAGELTGAEADVLFGYGALTQLIDDLEDVEQDRQAGLATVFSQTAGRWPLDGVTARTFHLGAQVLERLAAFDGPGFAPLRRLMERGLGPALAATAGHAARLHSSGFRQALEARSPFRFAFLDKVRQQLARRRALERVMSLA